MVDENKRLIKEASKELGKDLYQLKNFCSCLDNDLDDGVALRDKKSGRIFCFEYFDFQRGRGGEQLYDCRRSKCKFYCYTNPNQTKLTDFVK